MLAAIRVCQNELLLLGWQYIIQVLCLQLGVAAASVFDGSPTHKMQCL